MPLSLGQLNQRVERCLEKITDYREEEKLIVVENPSLETVSFNPVEFFKQLTSLQEQSLSQFEENAEALAKMFKIAAKAAKEEIKRRNNQKKIDNLQKKIALRIKRQNKNQAKERKRNRKIKSLCLNESQESSQEITDH